MTPTGPGRRPHTRAGTDGPPRRRVSPGPRVPSAPLGPHGLSGRWSLPSAFPQDGERKPGPCALHPRSVIGSPGLGAGNTPWKAPAALHRGRLPSTNQREAGVDRKPGAETGRRSLHLPGASRPSCPHGAPAQGGGPSRRWDGWREGTEPETPHGRTCTRRREHASLTPACEGRGRTPSGVEPCVPLCPCASILCCPRGHTSPSSRHRASWAFLGRQVYPLVSGTCPFRQVPGKGA